MEGAPAQGAGPAQGGRDQLGAAIVQVLDQVLVEARRVIVEERAHIGLADRLFRRQRAEAGELDAHAERILRLAVERRLQGSNGGLALARRELRAPEKRVGRREMRDELQHLRREIGRGGMVAPVEGGLGVAEAAIGEEIAGGAEHGCRMHARQQSKAAGAVNTAGVILGRRRWRRPEELVAIGRLIDTGWPAMTGVRGGARAISNRTVRTPPWTKPSSRSCAAATPRPRAGRCTTWSS